MRRRVLASFAVAVLACSPRPAPPEVVPSPAAPTAIPSAAAAASAAPELGERVARPPAPSLPAARAVKVERELDAPIRRLAIDREPHLAALTARSVWIHDAKGWREEPLPPALAADGTLEADVFYGRDYRVRVVGFRGPPDARTPVYLRWLPGGFKPAPDELGKLGAAKTGSLLAVLGTADPEVVCRPGEQCLVKRLSGWSRASAPADLAALAITGGAGFAVAGKQLLKLERDWASAAPPGSWDRADALFASGADAWVIESERDRLHRWTGSAWQVEASPLPRPRALFRVDGTEPSTLWLAADGGLAVFTSAAASAPRWAFVKELAVPLRSLAGRTHHSVWVGGDGGLFRVEEGDARIHGVPAGH